MCILRKDGKPLVVNLFWERVRVCVFFVGRVLVSQTWCKGLSYILFFREGFPFVNFLWEGFPLFRFWGGWVSLFPTCELVLGLVPFLSPF